MNDFEAFCKEKVLNNLKRTYCHGTPASIRLGFAMWSWQFKWYGPKGGEHREVFGRRNWMPHEEPNVCPRCGFIFSFIGCNGRHLQSHSKPCMATERIEIKDGVAFQVIDCEAKILESESNRLVSESEPALQGGHT